MRGLVYLTVAISVIGAVGILDGAGFARGTGGAVKAAPKEGAGFSANSGPSKPVHGNGRERTMGSGEREPKASEDVSANRSILDLARIRTSVRQGTEATLWPGDKRYRDTPWLVPGKTLVIADIVGPAVVTLLRIAKMPAHVFGDPAAYSRLNRGVVLEIHYDGEAEPAVRSPLADFFLDGSNGKARDLSTPLLEVVPTAYNCYIPMPFAKRCRISVRNDTDDLTWSSYFVVEWQRLPEWPTDAGYFHATWRRIGFDLTEKTREPFLRLKGKGHVLGRQFSIASDEPKYADLNFIMEGNNEIDIDGRKRAMEYLGSEDSFTFSWGWHRTFIGQKAGIAYLDMKSYRPEGSADAPPGRSRASIYRFHDHMPIRFDRELTWWIDWTNETFGEQSGWVDYATVHYWYQDSPAGYRHEPLPPASIRSLDILPKPSASS